MYATNENELSDFTLNVANLAAIAKLSAPYDSFLSSVKRDYSAHIEEVDFTDVNYNYSSLDSWIQKRTSNKVEKVFDQPPDSDTRIFLFNAIHFKDKWLIPFDDGATMLRAFYNENGAKKEVPTIFVRDVFNYADLPSMQIQIIELPYLNNVSFGIIYPYSRDGLSNVLQSLRANKFASITKKMKKIELELYMPKMKLDSSLDLKYELCELGMCDAFTRTADFSRISNESLFVSEAKHRCFLTIDESGSEATAVTAFKLYPRSMFFGPTIHIDHPFAFIIRDLVNGVHLFFGVVKNF
ncbi:antichymotrypsin-2-like isoform X3 [Dinothrombium tinctorium]|uniref:Antichymotrypsin-2-like isoform X3 n=1 Tax=Dinothrombium tinctorium TaxID=1965070 RepID=A0A3S3PA91_9ACAR|nr:antichymotrypsin-2-like isoform X3 [Dinothrombium tinctorium]